MADRQFKDRQLVKDLKGRNKKMTIMCLREPSRNQGKQGL